MELILHSKNYSVTVNSMGAELKSFCSNNEKEYIWNSNPEFWVRSSPLLFPTIGNVRDNQTTFNEQTYPMPKHGFCKDSEFSLTNHTDNTATFHLKASEETKKSYPFDFELELTYELEGNTLRMTYVVTNNGTVEMPYHLGAHPGFMCPLNTGESLSDYQLVFEKEEEFSAIPYDLENLCFSSQKHVSHKNNGNILPLFAEMFDNDAVFFPHTNSRSVKLVHHILGHGVKVDYPGFHSIAFWTPIGGNAPFLCIEPWNGAAIYDDEDDNFLHKRDVEILPAGEKKKYKLVITLLD